MSDGTDTLYVIAGETFEVIKDIQVTEDGEPLENLADLQYVRGYIYANVYETDCIVKIEPSTGKVKKRYHLPDLRKAEEQYHVDTNRYSTEFVLNGIAYDEKSESFFLTGVNWHLIFKVKLD